MSYLETLLLLDRFVLCGVATCLYMWVIYILSEVRFMMVLGHASKHTELSLSLGSVILKRIVRYWFDLGWCSNIMGQVRILILCSTKIIGMFSISHKLHITWHAFGHSCIGLKWKIKLVVFLICMVT